MNKKSLVILVIILSIIIGGGIYFYFSNKNKSDNQNKYEADKTSATESVTKNTVDENNNSTNQNEIVENQGNKINTAPQYSERQLSTFSTKIYSKDPARQNNIKITCNSLNGTTVKNGDTFSFCSTVGKATSAKGYQEADIYDNNGNKKKGLRRW